MPSESPRHEQANGTSCRQYSAPFLTNNVIYQNRSFIIGVEAVGPGTSNQQYVVKLKNMEVAWQATRPPPVRVRVAPPSGISAYVAIPGQPTIPVAHWHRRSPF